MSSESVPPSEEDLKIPYVDPELVSYLEGIIPDRLPPYEWDHRKIAFELGRRSVVEHLYSLMDKEDR